MKVKVICKSVIESHPMHPKYDNGLKVTALIDDAVEDAMEWFGYKKDYEKSLEITMKDISQAIRFFTPRQWGVCGHDADKKFIATKYSPIKNFIDRQHKICNIAIDAINNKYYEKNKLDLIINDKFTLDCILEPEDFFRAGDDLNSFATVKFIFSVFPQSYNTPFYLYRDEYNKKLENVLNTYHLKDSFEISEKIKKEICPVFEMFWVEDAFELVKKSYKGESIIEMDNKFDEELKKIGEKFKEKYPEFVEQYHLVFRKSLNIRVEYPLTDSDIEEITVNENKSVL